MKSDRTPETIRDYDTICSLFGENTPERTRIHDKIKEDPIYKKFNEWTRKIQFIGTNNNIPVAEILILIETVFGYTWDTIPFGKYHEVYDFVRKNAETRYRYINRKTRNEDDPQTHEYLLLTGYYKHSSTEIDRKLTAITMNNLLAMMEAGLPKEDFFEYGKKILK